MRPGASLVVPAMGAPSVTSQATQFGMRPRVRSGYALKRLDASEGNKRWVLRDLHSGTFLRLSDNDAQLFELFDGTRSLVDLIGEAEQRFGGLGPARLARLLADLGERGFLAGVAKATPDGGEEAPKSLLQRLFTPRSKTFSGLGTLFERLYRAGGWVLFTRPALIFIATLIVAGIGIFGYLIAGRYGTPFVVAEKFGLGGLVFLGGRFLVVLVHECAHGMAMASYGRKVERAGLKLMFIFPYAFVDTSEAWFEPRRRRIAISAAGPVSDFSLGAIFSLCCLLFPDGTVRDIFFNLAFAAYVGAFFNLNPFIDRDGYQILVDVLREPGLRRRAKAQLSRRLSGQKNDETDSPVLARYGIWGLVWTVVFAGCAIFMTLRYKPIIDNFAADYVVWTVLITLWVAFFIPAIVVLAQAPDDASARSVNVATSEADIAAQLIERLLGDPAFRAEFRRDPATACRNAGLDQLADEMSLGAGKAMMTLENRESKSSLAGVMMAAAMEGVSVYQFGEHVMPHIEDVPGVVGDVLSKVNLPALSAPLDLKGALAGSPATSEPPPAPANGDGAADAANGGGGRWRGRRGRAPPRPVPPLRLRLLLRPRPSTPRRSRPPPRRRPRPRTAAPPRSPSRIPPRRRRTRSRPPRIRRPSRPRRSTRRSPRSRTTPRTSPRPATCRTRTRSSRRRRPRMSRRAGRTRPSRRPPLRRPRPLRAARAPRGAPRSSRPAVVAVTRRPRRCSRTRTWCSTPTRRRTSAAATSTRG